MTYTSSPKEKEMIRYYESFKYDGQGAIVNHFLNSQVRIMPRHVPERGPGGRQQLGVTEVGAGR
jgi:hypothetical protein